MLMYSYHPVTRHTGHIRRSIRMCRNRTPESDFDIGPQTENRLKKLVRILTRTA